jgi:hypothetical protein
MPVSVMKVIVCALVIAVSTYVRYKYWYRCF